MKYFYLLIIIFFISCANEKKLTGGDKDISAPEIKNIYPENKTTKFNSSTIEIEFDERIKLENFQKNLIISPRIKIDIKTKVKNKNLKLQLEGKFKPNTTYTLNMRNSISDITENNKIDNLKYIFSTGDYIDSCLIKGTTSINETKNKQESAKILLYNNSDTINIRKNLPLYYTLTDKNGEYKIENLPKGEYKIYYLNDKNNNLLFDDEKEEIAFLNNLISIDSNIIVENLNVFENDTIIKKPKMNEYCNYTKLIFEEEIYDYSIINRKLPSLKTKDNKNIVIYNSINLDSIDIITEYIDNNNNKLIDTNIIYKSEDSLCKRNIKLELETNNINIEDSIVYNFNEPIKQFNKESIYIYYDSILVENLTKFNHYITDNQIVINFKSNIKENISIKFDSTAIISYQENMKFYQTENTIPLVDETKVGKLSGKLNYDKNNFIIELLDQNFTVINKTKNKYFKFEKLKPQDYYIRVKIDDNNDGIYQTGNYDKNELPEKIVFHNEKINLRPNWEIEDIIIDIYTE